MEGKKKKILSLDLPKLSVQARFLILNRKRNRFLFISSSHSLVTFSTIFEQRVSFSTPHLGMLKKKRKNGNVLLLLLLLFYPISFLPANVN